MIGTILTILAVWFLISIPVSLVTARFLLTSVLDLDFANLEMNGKIELMPVSSEVRPEQTAAAQKLA